MAKELEIRKLQKNDLEGLSSLYTEVYGKRYTATFWEWKYFKNPHGEHMMYIALDNGKIIGEMGTIPVKVKLGKDVVTASQTCDITIHIDYQKGGPFFNLHKLSRNENEQRAIYFIYGFSVPKTLKISTKLLKFRSVCEVWRWVFILNRAPYLAKKLKSRVLAGCISPVGRLLIKARLKKRHCFSGTSVVEVFHFDERFDRFWEEQQSDHNTMIVRDSTYLNWRYSVHPIRRYKTLAYIREGKLRGFIILTIATDEVCRGIILDIMVDPSEKDVLDHLLSNSMDFLEREKADAVMLWLPADNPLIYDFERWGFVKRDTQHNLIVDMVAGSKDARSHLLDHKNWFFTLGDSDYY